MGLATDLFFPAVRGVWEQWEILMHGWLARIAGYGRLPLDFGSQSTDRTVENMIRCSNKRLVECVHGNFVCYSRDTVAGCQHVFRGLYKDVTTQMSDACARSSAG